jgi:hypothetical protein
MERRRDTSESTYIKGERPSKRGGIQATMIDIVTSIHYHDAVSSFPEIPISETCMKVQMSNEKIGLVREHPFEKYCEENIKPQTSWGIKVPILDLISFTSDLIKKPLTKLDKKHLVAAKQVFKNIISFMKERHSSRGSCHHALKILKVGIGSSVELCDEIFIMLVKQTNNNSKL